MKKRNLLLTFALSVLFICGMNAQNYKMWVGVDLSYNSVKIGKADATNSFYFGPTFGYHVNDNISAGLHFHYSSPGKDLSAFDVAPFVRYSKGIGDKATLFGELSVEYETEKDKTTATEIKTNSFGVGISPGVTYRFADRWGAQAYFGRLGYTTSKTKTGTVTGDANTAFGLDLTMNTLALGLTYHF